MTRRPPLRLVAAFGLAVLGPALMGLGACGPETPRAPRGSRGFPAPPPAERSSLVLVTLDTFRADAAGCGGSPAAHTPWIDRLARTGVQAETGLAATPLTAPSHATVLTGVNPPVHTIRDNGTYHLAEGVPTLAETLGERGFATGGFIAAFPLLGRFGFSRGFAHFDDAVGPVADSGEFLLAQRPGDEVVDAAAAWLGTLPPDQRFLAWIHLFDAHGPHDCPRPWVWAAGGDDYLGDAAWTDAHVGRLVRGLAETGRPHWILLTGDHGESRGEHGEDTHGIFIYDATIRVPAVIWPAPAGAEAGVHRATFRGVDVPATAFALLGLPEADAPGVGAAAPGAAPARASYAESRYGEIHYGWSELRSLRDGRWKYIRTTDPELYDLHRDPGERSNVLDAHADTAAALAARLEEMLRDEAASASAELTDEERAVLESLGYVTDQAPAPADGEPRPDPKRMLRVQQLLFDAMESLAAGQPAAALRSLQAALGRDPSNPEVHRLFGMAHAASGRLEPALDSLIRAGELAGDADDAIRLERAGILMRLGRPEDAARDFQVLLDRDPENTDSWYNLGVARHAQGRIAEARAHWQQALELDPYNREAGEALRRTPEPADGEPAAADSAAPSAETP